MQASQVFLHLPNIIHWTGCHKHAFIINRELILMTFVTLWVFLQYHHEFVVFNKMSWQVVRTTKFGTAFGLFLLLVKVFTHPVKKSQHLLDGLEQKLCRHSGNDTFWFKSHSALPWGWYFWFWVKYLHKYWNNHHEILSIFSCSPHVEL